LRHVTVGRPHGPVMPRRLGDTDSMQSPGAMTQISAVTVMPRLQHRGTLQNRRALGGGYLNPAWRRGSVVSAAGPNGSVKVGSSIT